MKKMLFIDTANGFTLEIMLSALVDMGIDFKLIEAGLHQLPIKGYSLASSKTTSCGVSATAIELKIDEEAFKDSLGDIQPDCSGAIRILSIAPISDITRKKVESAICDIYKAQKATAKEQTSVKIPAVQEWGSTILLTTSIALCLEQLQPEIILANEIGCNDTLVNPIQEQECNGMSAFLHLLTQGKPVRMIRRPYTVTTPIAAALLNHLVVSWTTNISMTQTACGWGRSSLQGEEDRLLRVFLGEETSMSNRESLYTGINAAHSIIVECSIDDMNPELYEHVLEQLFTCGVDDVNLFPITMKKSRPATMIRILCREDLTDAILDILYTQTTTLGARIYPVYKNMLQRATIKVSTPWGEIGVKQGIYKDRIIKQKPEFEECRQAALKNGVPVQNVIASAFMEAQYKLNKEQ